MATSRIKVPSDLRSATWYPQFQETAGSITLPANKRFGATKRVAGISPTAILQKMTNIRAQYGDVNGVIEPNKTWKTFKAVEANGVKGYAEAPFNGTLGAGQTINYDLNAPGATTNDIPAINNFQGIKKNGSNFYAEGFSTKETIVNPNQLRITLTNSSSVPIDLNGTVVFGTFYHPTQVIAQNMYNDGVREGTPTFTEFNENGIPFDKVEEIFSKLYDIIKANNGAVTSPDKTELYGDYYQALNGYSNDVSFNQTGDTPSQLRLRMTSQFTARSGNKYYDGANNYRNHFVGGYYDGIRHRYDGAGMYSHIFNIERSFLAQSDRKVATFGWGSFEGIAGGIDGAKWQRLPLAGGDLIRLSRAEGSYTMTENQAFFSVFLGNTYVMWNDGGIYGTNINCWNKGFIGGDDPNTAPSWKTLWQPTGGTIVEYDASNPSHPKSVCAEGQSKFSDSAADNLNGGYSGVYLYSQIQNRCNNKIKYGTFNYSGNDGNKSGYASGDIPVAGAKGDASANTFGNANAGQSNVVSQWENKKPLLYECHGTEGNAIVILNIYAGLTETITYNITTQYDGLQTISHTGPELGVYIITSGGGGGNPDPEESTNLEVAYYTN